jgi:hypothetical protein
LYAGRPAATSSADLNGIWTLGIECSAERAGAAFCGSPVEIASDALNENPAVTRASGHLWMMLDK